MSPRPFKATDEQVFEAAGRVMARVGPAQLTLAEIAAEAGLTAGALVQRFGSKRELLVAFSKRASEATPDLFTGLRAANPSPLAALRAYGDCMAQMGESPGALANHFAYLQLDLGDPALRRQTMRQARSTRAGLRALVADAISAGELVPETDPDRLARTVEVTLGGSLIAWGFYQEGSAAGWLREDLDAVLVPYLAPPVGRSTRAKGKRERRRNSV